MKFKINSFRNGGQFTSKTVNVESLDEAVKIAKKRADELCDRFERTNMRSHYDVTVERVTSRGLTYQEWHWSTRMDENECGWYPGED